MNENDRGKTYSSSEVVEDHEVGVREASLGEQRLFQ